MSNGTRAGAPAAHPASRRTHRPTRMAQVCGVCGIVWGTHSAWLKDRILRSGRLCPDQARPVCCRIGRPRERILGWQSPTKRTLSQT